MHTDPISADPISALPVAGGPLGGFLALRQQAVDEGLAKLGNKRGSVVDVPAMPEAHDQHYELLVLNPAEETVVLHTIAPELAEIPFEALAELSGIITSRNACIEEGKNPP